MELQKLSEELWRAGRKPRWASGRRLGFHSAGTRRRSGAAWTSRSRRRLAPSMRSETL